LAAAPAAKDAAEASRTEAKAVVLKMVFFCILVDLPVFQMLRRDVSLGFQPVAIRKALASAKL
jgi:hypothetical protein